MLAALRVLNRLDVRGRDAAPRAQRAGRRGAGLAAARTWRRCGTTWAERYGARFDAPRLPKDEAAREALAVAIGADGYRLLRAVYAPDAPDWLRAVPAVETLRRVWVQQYHAPETPATPDAPESAARRAGGRRPTSRRRRR